ncbi:unnamed protein product [Caenorhabditis angaria]|uniref:Uncharacterized protein n=1 Tax=Caenorhabditis angaria TaxID=860376 RepID=A0A9P1II78_9PELO|nr:unnamed protein product [Caenorhabditis angaria]
MNDPNAFLLMLTAAAQQQQQQQKMQVQKEKEKEQVKNGELSVSPSTSSSASSSTVNLPENPNPQQQISAETILMWQTMMQAQLMQQMAANVAKNAADAEKKRKEEEAKKLKAKKLREEAENMQKVQVEMMLKKLMQQHQQAKSSNQPTTSSATSNSQQSTAANSNSNQNPLKNLVDNAMWQLVANQMIQQQQTKIEQEHQKLLDEKEEDPEKKKAKIADFQARVPLKFGWKRQTCVRMITAGGVRGDVIYYAPCGKKLTTYAEVQRYLAKNATSFISRDNFYFNARMIIGEFIVPKGDGDFLKLSEEEMAKELAKLLSIKTPATDSELTPKPAPLENPQKKLEKINEPPLEPLVEEDLNPDDVEDHMPQSFTEEHKSREPNEDLLVHEFRQLADLSRIENQCLDGEAFGNALMIFEFVKNFGAVLGIPDEISMGIEELCAGIGGEQKVADRFLGLVRKLLRLAMEFPGIEVEKQKTRFGEGGGDLGMDRENFSEVMRLFLDNRPGNGPKLAKNLENRTFLQLESLEKSQILAFICDELVSSKNVVNEIDRNLEEISRLKGEKWMREGKARALRGAIHGAQPKVTEDRGAFGQCEVLSKDEEKMSIFEMEQTISELTNEANSINRRINETNLKIRCAPFGFDRFYRHYWILPNIDTIFVESIESGGKNNPACEVLEIAKNDPPPLLSSQKDFIDCDVVACVEDLIDSTILTRANADNRLRKRYRRIDNRFKYGWWTIDSMKALDALRTSLHGRGVRERCLHRLLTKTWFLNELKFGKLTLLPVETHLNHSKIHVDSWNRIEKAANQLIRRIQMSDVSKLPNSDPKPIVTPASMSLSQVVQDDEVWLTYEPENALLGSQKEPEKIIEKIQQIPDMVAEKFWRPCRKIEDWSEFLAHAQTDGVTTSQLMAAVQTLESWIAWEKSAREAICQICKSQDGDEMLVCDGCETGCHMECFRPVMKSVPNGDWFCPRCKEERNPAKKICMFCGKEAKDKDKDALFYCVRCALHTHLECANDASNHEKSADGYKCPNCVDAMTMRFVKPAIFRSESVERKEQQEEQQQQGEATETTEVATATKRKHVSNASIVLPLELVVEICTIALDDLEAHAAAGPFLEPVNLRAVPGYRKVIQQPMDLSTVRKRNSNAFYENVDEFAADIQLIFDNCKTFNMDDSPVGQAGINLSKFFQKRWKALKMTYSKKSNKRLKI